MSNLKYRQSLRYFVCIFEGHMSNRINAITIINFVNCLNFKSHSHINIHFRDDNGTHNIDGFISSIYLMKRKKNERCNETIYSKKGTTKD